MVSCSRHGGWVPDHEAQIIDMVVTGSGPGVAVYACHQCVRDQGLVPRAAFTGRRDAAPSRTGTA